MAYRATCADTTACSFAHVEASTVWNNFQAISRVSSLAFAWIFSTSHGAVAYQRAW
jgi:hypothetical protein